MSLLPVVPGYISHLFRVDSLEGRTDSHQLLASIKSATLDPAYEGDIAFDARHQGMAEYKLRLYFHYLSQAPDAKNPFKGMIISRLSSQILEIVSRSANSAALASHLISHDSFRRNPNLRDIAGKIDYASKTTLGRYAYHLKKETRGSSPILVLIGLVALISGFFALFRAQTLESNDAYYVEESSAMTRISIGTSLVLTPFFKAALGTAIGDP